MPRILLILLAFGISFLPVTFPVVAQEIIVQTQETQTEAGELLNEAFQLYQQGKIREALAVLQQAVVIFREIGDHKQEASCLTGIGLMYDHLGQPDRSLKHYEQALIIQREIGERAREGGTLNNIGAVYRNLGKYEQALNYYRQALAIAQEVGDRSGENTILSNMGGIYKRIGQPTEAIDYLEQSVTITLEMRRGLLKENRQSFLKAEQGTAIEPIDLLIEQN